VNAQQGINALYGSEQFFVGGLYSVRGFRNTSIAGDSGYYWRNELSMPIRLDNWPVTVKPFVGFDMGHIRDRFGVAGGDLSGVALGVSVSSPRVNTEISFAKPLKMPARLTDEGLQLFAKLNVPF
jgi:hemolysin activation/secretion protein